MMWLPITDYKIKSKKILFSVVAGQIVIATLLLLTDLFMDLKSGPVSLFAAYLVLSVGVGVVCIKNPDSRAGRFALSLLIFLILEALFLGQPASFKTILYWFPFIPIVALMVLGLRASQVWSAFIMIVYLANVYYVRQTLGPFYPITVNSDITFMSGIIFLTAILSSMYLLYYLLGNAYSSTVAKNTELHALKNTIEQKSQLLTSYNAALIELTRSPETYQSMTVLLSSVCKILQNKLEVTRVSIWLLNQDNSAIELQFLYEEGQPITDRMILQKTDFPAYFNAIENKPFIMASEAKTHPDTAEFKTSYLDVLGIESMLDCPILLDQKSIGVICCEQKNVKKEWAPEDALITQSMADFIAIQFKNEQIKQLMETLQKQNKELSQQRDEIGSMNQELQALNAKLTQANSSLESAVNERTKELLIQNNQLQEYAFVNSHVLRAPISSILGISNLLHPASTDDEELLDALHKSTSDLDEIVKNISSSLEQKSQWTHEDINQMLHGGSPQQKNKS